MVYRWIFVENPMFDRKDIVDLAMKPWQPTSMGVTVQDQHRFSQSARRCSYRVLLRLLANTKFPFQGTVSSTRCTRLQDSDQVTISGRSLGMAM